MPEANAQKQPPVVLIVRDGWGENPHAEHDAFNAVKLADTPVADRLMEQYPHTLIKTSGEDVGLPKGTMGNSEVGHQNIGAGRIVDQEVMRITRAIDDKSFFDNKALRGAFAHAEETGGNVHIMGLLSDGQVHSDITHCFALVDLAAKLKFEPKRLFIHIFTDGRDTGPNTGVGFVEQLETKLKDAEMGRIASVTGRFYAMDRDHRWERIAAAYAGLTGRKVSHPQLQKFSVQLAANARKAVERYYESPSDQNRRGDEFIVPTRIVDRTTSQPLPGVSDGDSVIFFNFRGDRPRELTKAFTLNDDCWAEVKGGGFDRGEHIDNLFFCTMTGYEEGLAVSAIAFHKPPKMPNILGQIVSEAGLAQFRCAETEKFAHVTFFFNDYREDPFPGEHRLLCPSPQEISTYDQKPEMAAYDVCDGVVGRLRADDCESLLVVNFANGDMVGHTGRLDAAIRAIEVVDVCVGRIVDAALERGANVIVTADHGNAEQMWNPETGSPHTAHTTYDVPLILVGKTFRLSGEHSGTTLREGGRLADIAPTILELMDLKQPKDMTGKSLVAG